MAMKAAAARSRWWFDEPAGLAVKALYPGRYLNCG